jgi:HSP20 family molecular chaperone IbpA
MSFFYNSRALFPPVGPTVLYSSPYAASPFGWNSLACGPSCGSSSRAAWGRPRLLLAKRHFDEISDDKFFDTLFDAFAPFPQTKYSRYDESSDEEDQDDDMDVDCDGCDSGAECAGTDDACECEATKPSEAQKPSEVPVSSNSEDSKAEDKGNSTPSSQLAEPEKPASALAKQDEPVRNLFKSFFSDEQKFKVDETEDLVTVTSNWNGFNKADLSVDFKNGALLIVSGKSEVETKDEKSGVSSKSYKSVSKTIRLPSNINKEGISAKFNDSSVLTITVPKVKKPEKEADTIVIN